LAKGVERSWPDDDTLLKIAGEHTSILSMARSMNATDVTLNRALGRRGLLGRVKKIQRGLAEARIATIEPVEPVPVTDPTRVKVTQQAAQIKALKSENAAYAEALATQEEFWAKVVDIAPVPVEVPSFKTAKRAKGTKPARSVITPIYDQQYGQFVRAEDTPGNQGLFNLAVFDQRLVRWVEGVKGILGHYSEAYALEELIIPLGGDHVEGDEIFAGQPWQLEIDPLQQMFTLAAKMVPALLEVIRFAREELGVKHVGVYCVPGNHGKVGGKRGGARPATYSWDWGFHKLVEDRLAETVDEYVIESGGAVFFYCAGHQFQAIHGDQIRGWGGLPFYGLSRFDGRSIRLHNVMYRYLLMGHHHQPAQIPNGAGETIVSGDWVGANNLSGFITAGSRPRQEVIFVAEKWGVTGTERVWFTGADEAYTPTAIHGREAA